MENQHRLIQGYRELSKEEIALMNEIKAKGIELGNLLEKVRLNAITQATSGETAVVDRHAVTEPFRWLALAKTNAQQSIMFAVRAVAQPDDGF